jgi:hypothetical protein
MVDREGHGPGAAFGAGILADERRRLWVRWEGDQTVSATATFLAWIIHVNTACQVPRRTGGES